MKFFVLVCVLFSQLVWSAQDKQEALRTALIVTIDQQFFVREAVAQLEQHPAIVKNMLEPLTTDDKGAFGQAVKKFLSYVASKSLMESWDAGRADWVTEQAEKIYTNVYVVTGASARDDTMMSALWAVALAENDVIDYVSMVHGGYQNIKDGWNVPRDSKKLRMVYSEACKGGSGRIGFVDTYGAMFSAGHTDNTKYNSASPFFSFFFLEAWLAGKPYYEALSDAWKKGTALIQKPESSPINQIMSSNPSTAASIEASQIIMASQSGVDVFSATIHTPWTEGDGDESYEIALE